MTVKTDYLNECNEHRVPFQDFESQFCSRCLQRECTRSRVSSSRFENRVLTWEDRLFKNVPKLDPTDDRFKTITSQRFISIGTSNGPSTWDDPRGVEPTKAYSIPSPIVEKVPEPIVDAPKPVIVGVLANTPNKPRQMIGGAEDKSTTSVYDPWKSVTPLKPGEVVVKPGAKIKLG